MNVRNPAFRYHGGKFRLAPWVIQHFPPHKTYVEAFGGAAGVIVCALAGLLFVAWLAINA